MRVVLDACVLYPTVMREVLLGAASAGLFTPLFSTRILDEWRRAVRRNLPDQAATADVEIALLTARWPKAVITPVAGDDAGLFLPDSGDVHVLATAISARATVLVTSNLKDFPTRTLAAHGILRRDPDGFLMDFLSAQESQIADVCTSVRARAEALSGQPQPLRPLLKKAHLPRLGKALALRD